MRKAFLCVMCLVAIAVAGTSLKAQEVAVTLEPGWTWMCSAATDTLDFETVLGDFTPMDNDVIKSQWGQARYRNGVWQGNISQFYPGHGYMYKSNRTEPVTLTMGTPLVQLAVVTSEPTDVGSLSAVVGGTVVMDDGLPVISRGICWSTRHDPSWIDRYATGNLGTGSFSCSLTGLTPATTYYARAYVSNSNMTIYGNEITFVTDVDGSGTHEYVDLGLPSGTLWASCNVGANAPEEYGGYFAWGETHMKTSYAWGNYRYCQGSDITLTKYCSKARNGYNGFTDTLTVLQPADDAALANWGPDWRMPTKTEWEELVNNTTQTWTTRNGVNGRLFTASNGNSIFLPAAGRSADGGFVSVGRYGYYWSSSLYTDTPCDGWNLYFGSSNCSHIVSGRFFGRSVRAVRTMPQNYYDINVSADPTIGGVVSGSGTFGEGEPCTVHALANNGYVFSKWTENGEQVSTDADYTFTVNMDRTLVAVFVHEYVDLGLPSGTLWATCNVGTDVPEGYGEYFSWGEIQPKENYNWNTYQYCNGSQNTLTKYCNNSIFGYNGFVDELTFLLPEDDVATANWGSEWRMPTREDWQELFDNTTVEETTWNGVNGCMFTASNGNSIFLPAAGRYTGSSINYVGSASYYWSGALNTVFPSGAWRLYFSSGSCNTGSDSRYSGLPVRAVRPLPQD